MFLTEHDKDLWKIPIFIHRQQHTLKEVGKNFSKYNCFSYIILGYLHLPYKNIKHSDMIKLLPFPFCFIHGQTRSLRPPSFTPTTGHFKTSSASGYVDTWSQGTSDTAGTPSSLSSSRRGAGSGKNQRVSIYMGCKASASKISTRNWWTKQNEK